MDRCEHIMKDKFEFSYKNKGGNIILKQWYIPSDKFHHVLLERSN